MGKLIRITVDAVVLEAELSDTECAGAIYEALPIDTAFNTWGEEFYFDIPISRELDDTATTSVKVGDIGYWPPGSAMAIFYGRTPASTGEDPVPASEVNLVGRITGDARLLKNAEGAGRIRIEKVSI